MKRTDLAMEAHSMWMRAQARQTMPGIRYENRHENGVETTVVQITDAEGARVLGKPQGEYVCMEFDPRSAQARRVLTGALARQLVRILPQLRQGSVMVVGLGNRAVTPDALGPKTVDGLLVTRHLSKELSFLRPVSALCPGVLAQTGTESIEVVRGVLRDVRPSCVIVVDALAAAEPEHIGAVVQLSDAGIQPGAGVGNHRAAFDRKSLGVPVAAVGVPTVWSLDSAGKNMIVTPADIDAELERLAGMLARGINFALHPELRPEEIEEFVS